MACKVFGSPVTDETVRKFKPNVSKITAKHRAEAAVRCLNAAENVNKVKSFVRNLRGAGLPPGTSTHGMICNATGGVVTLDIALICEGYMVGPFPKTIQNGQCAVFQHANPEGECTASVIYNGTNEDGDDCDWMYAWNITEDDSPNHVFTKILGNDRKTVAMLKKQPSSDSDSWGGCYSCIKVGTGSSPELVAVMGLDDLDPNCMAMARDVSKWINA